MSEAFANAVLMLDRPGIKPLAAFDLDLTGDGVLRHFLESTGSVRLSHFMLSLDRVDEWALDFSRGEAGEAMEIKVLLHELSEIVKENAPAMHLGELPEQLSALLAHMTSSRSICVLQYIAARNPDFLVALVRIVMSSDSVNVMTIRKRLEAVTRAQLLSKIFSPERTREVLQILKGYAGNE